MYCRARIATGDVTTEQLKVDASRIIQHRNTIYNNGTYICFCAKEGVGAMCLRLTSAEHIGWQVGTVHTCVYTLSDRAV